MSKLNELAKMHGINLKDLAKKAKIPYSSVLYLSQQNVDKWRDDYTQQLSIALNLQTSELLQIMHQPLLSPFVKWVGGKRQLLPELLKYVPKQFNTYYEPFVGGGALLLKIAPKKARINDYNEELTNAWITVKNNSDKLAKILKKHEILDSKEHYLQIRSADRDGRIVQMNSIERAARFIYLNKAGFNGLWRVNQKGQNNVPFGGHKKLNLVPELLFDDAEYLANNNIRITHGDYYTAISRATKDDFIYLDPPYIPVSPTASFTSYTKNGFGLVQQQELAKNAQKLAKKGAKVMLSNADVPLIDELYHDDIFHIHHVKASRAINSNGKKRGKVGEVIITTY